MHSSFRSTAFSKQRAGFATKLARQRRLGPAVLIALAAVAALAFGARTGCAQSLPAAWVADERTAQHGDGRTFAERTPADDRAANTAVPSDGRSEAAYTPPYAPPGPRPRQVESLGRVGGPNASNNDNDVVPMAPSADAPALAPAPQKAHFAPAVSLSPPRPAVQMEPPPESRSPQHSPEDGKTLGANGEIGRANNRQPTLLPAPAVKSPSDPVNLTPHRQSDSEGRGSGVRALGTIAGSLAIVLTLLFVALWLLRRTVPAAAQPLPAEVVEVLGRAPLSGRQQMHLLRCGRKLLLVSVTPECAKTLTEITDPLEVDRLAGLCQQNRPNSATAAFRRVFEQFASGQSEK